MSSCSSLLDLLLFGLDLIYKLVQCKPNASSSYLQFLSCIVLMYMELPLSLYIISLDIGTIFDSRELNRLLTFVKVYLQYMRERGKEGMM